MSDAPDEPKNDDAETTPNPDSPETPAAPGAPAAPAAAAPVPPVPPVAGPAQPAAAPPGPDGAPAKKSKLGLFIGLGVGALLLVLGAIAAVVFLVLPLIFGGGSSGGNPVRDYSTEPDTDWKYDYAGDVDEEYLDAEPSFISVGDDQALVWSEFDYYAWLSEQDGGYSRWYEGYDDDYDTAYEAGVAYDAAKQLWYDDRTYTVEYPAYDEYFLDEWYDAANYEGFSDGWYDAIDGEENGANRAVKPEDPEYTPILTLLDLDSGDEIWTLDLADAADADYESSFTARNIAGSAYIAVTVDGDEESDSQLLTVDRASGEIVSTLDAEGTISVDGVDGDVIVLVSDEDSKGTIARLDPAKLDGDAVWEAKSRDAYSVSAIAGDYIRVIGDDGGEVLEAETGDEADWGDDIGDDGVFYSIVGSQLLRVETDEDYSEFEIEGYGFDGESVWDDSIETDYFTVEGSALFIADGESGDFDALMRINPANGEPMWDDEYDEEVQVIGGVMGDRLILGTPKERLVVLDLGNGEEVYDTKFSDASGIWIGTSQFYIESDDELVAMTAKDDEEVWAFDLDDDETITRMGDRLVLLNTDKRQIVGLK